MDPGNSPEGVGLCGNHGWLPAAVSCDVPVKHAINIRNLRLPVKTWIVDIDGTVAIMGDRSPFDWARVGEDLPNIR